MERITRKKPADMSMYELENGYIERLKARSGGVIMMIVTVPFILVSWYFHVTIAYWFFAACFLLWAIMTYSIHNDVVEIREQLKIRLGVDND